MPAPCARPSAGADGRWRANAWVKAGILLGFRLGRTGPAATGRPFPFYDKDTYPLRALGPEDGVRLVPGGSAIRDGCYVARGVVCMPPMYINVGAYVDEGTMVDSHALVGSCAQIGRRVHLSAAAQIGGRARAGRRAAGDHRGRGAGRRQLRRLRGHGRARARRPGAGHAAHRRDGGVRPGARPGLPPRGRPAAGDPRRRRGGPGHPAGAIAARAREAGIALYAPVIVKYRDEKTDTAVRLEDLLR